MDENQKKENDEMKGISIIVGFAIILLALCISPILVGIFIAIIFLMAIN